MKKSLLIAVFPLAVSAADLETNNYLIDIESGCDEGNVSCNQMIYKGTSKRSGNSITLKGSTWHTTCADGVSPCRFLGYKFENGNIIYYIHENGLLEVVRNRDEILVSEQGKWKK